MRKLVWALLALLASASAAPAQGSWADKMFKAGLTHDFGSVPRGAQLFHRFKITNIYAVRLDIIQVRTSCGCVTVTPSAQALEPRQEAFVDVTMDARRFTGPKTVSIYLTVGPEFVSTATMQVSANSRADVVFNPGQVSFGVVARGQTPTQHVDVEYAGALDWRVNGVEKNTAALDVGLKELYRRPGQVGYRVAVTLKPDAPPGALKQELLLRTNDPASPLVPVLVEATVQAPLTVVPGTVNFGRLKVGETATRRVVIRGSRPFLIQGVDGLDGGLTADLPQTPAPVQSLTVKFQPSQPGDVRRQLQIRTTLEGEAPATVHLEGTAVAP
jgi:hypothetical protein